MILETIGATLIGYSVIQGTYNGVTYVFSKDRAELTKANRKLVKVFYDAELYQKIKRGTKTLRRVPNTISSSIKKNTITLIFAVPKGMNPRDFSENEYVFRQHFGKHISLKMEDNRGILKISKVGLPNKVTYNYNSILDSLIDKNLPIPCGVGIDGQLKVVDMTINPHILIGGETGSGKSSAIRSILSTIIQFKDVNEVRLLLGDLKRSEFHLFKNLKHVNGVYHSAQELDAPLRKVKKEMTKRGNMLDNAEVNSIDELDKKPSYIIVCIDEVVLLKKETALMDILEEISSIGRSLGVFLILSMQRPDAKLLDGALKVNMTVRMGFKTADAVNAKIIGTEGSEKLETAGRMILKVNSNSEQVQCAWLSNDKAKTILKQYKVKKVEEDVSKTETEDEYSKVRELFNNEES